MVDVSTKTLVNEAPPTSPFLPCIMCKRDMMYTHTRCTKRHDRGADGRGANANANGAVAAVTVCQKVASQRKRKGRLPAAAQRFESPSYSYQHTTNTWDGAFRRHLHILDQPFHLPPDVVHATTRFSRPKTACVGSYGVVRNGCHPPLTQRACSAVGWDGVLCRVPPTDGRAIKVAESK